MSIFQDVTNALRKAGEERKEEHITVIQRKRLMNGGKDEVLKHSLSLDRQVVMEEHYLRRVLF